MANLLPPLRFFRQAKVLTFSPEFPRDQTHYCYNEAAGPNIRGPQFS